MARDNDITNENTGATRMGSTRDDRTMTDGSRDDGTMMNDGSRDDRSMMTDGNRDDRTMVTDGTRHSTTDRSTDTMRGDRALGRDRSDHDGDGRPDEVDLRDRERHTAVAHEHVARQHEFYGGFKWGAAFFGWLSANGLTVLLVAIVAAAGVALGLTNGVDTQDATNNADTLGLGGAIALLVILAIGYFAGGYVAGRMSRFDGARQGLGVWILGLVITIIAAVAGAILGSEYNIFSQLNLPNIPIDSGTLTTGGIIALLAALAVTVLAAIFGGKVGERYHRKIDRVAVDA